MAVLALRGGGRVWRWICGGMVASALAGGEARGQNVRPAAAGETPPGGIVAGAGVLIVEPPAGTPGAASDALLQRRINTHVATMGSEQQLRKVVGQGAGGEIRKTRWFGEGDGPAERAAWLRDHVRVAAVPGTSLIQVTVDAVADPAERSTIVREVCETYLSGLRRDWTDQLLDRTRVLNTVKIHAEARLKDLRADMKAKQVELNLSGGAVGAGGGRMGVKEIELSKLVSEQVEAQLGFAKMQGAYQAAARAANAGQALPGEQELIRRLHPYLSDDEHQLRLLEVELRQVTSQTGAENPKVQEIARRVDRMRKDYEHDYDDARGKARVQILEELAQAAQAAKLRVDSLNQRVDNLKENLGELSNAIAQYATLEREERGLVDQLRVVKEEIERIMAQQSSAGSSAAEVRWHLMPEGMPVK